MKAVRPRCTKEEWRRFFSIFWKLANDDDERSEALFDDRFIEMARIVSPGYTLPTTATYGAEGEGGEADSELGGAADCLSSYLNRMYRLRKKWALVFLHNRFTGTTRTTGRNESTHAVISAVIGKVGRSSLRKFASNFNEMVASDFERADRARGIRATRAALQVGSTNPIAVQARSVLSFFAWRHVDAEFSRSADYSAVVEGPPSADGQLSQYVVRHVSITPIKLFNSDADDLPTADEDAFFVRDRIVNVVLGADCKPTNITCTCRMPIWLGLPCRHILRVLTARQCSGLPGANDLPPFLYLKRWLKDVGSDISVFAGRAARTSLLTTSTVTARTVGITSQVYGCYLTSFFK